MPPFFQLDLIAVTSIAAYLLMAAITLTCAPKRDTDSRLFGQAAIIIAGTVLAYASQSLSLFAFAWFLTVLPALSGKRILPKATLAASALLIALGAVLAETDHTLAFAAVASGALLRKGILPFHGWVNETAEEPRLALFNLVFNAHLGGFVIIRFGVPMFREVASSALSFLGILAIVTAVYMAVLALAEKRPRRILALLCTSQASFILAGLENRNEEGITGALLHWWVVAFAATAMLSVYRALEVRNSEVESPHGYLGLGFHAPRLAVFFAIAGLALIGMPGTLGFAAEDLLFHGSIESHPLLGIGLPLATALNAITVFRLFATLFLGRRGIHVPKIADALPRERWALTVTVVLLVTGGLVPGVLAAFRAPSAHYLASLLAGRR